MDRVLDKLTVDRFKGEIGKTFRLTPESAPAIEVVLIEARDLSLQSSVPGAKRAPFALVFRSPSGPVLPQRIYALENETLGRLDIFLVPIGADKDGVQYEAIFN